MPLYGRNFSKLLKKYDEIVSLLAKNRQKQKLKTGMSHNPKKVVNTLIPKKKTILPPCHQRHLKK